MGVCMWHRKCNLLFGVLVFKVASCLIHKEIRLELSTRDLCCSCPCVAILGHAKGHAWPSLELFAIVHLHNRSISWSLTLLLPDFFVATTQPLPGSTCLFSWCFLLHRNWFYTFRLWIQHKSPRLSKYGWTCYTGSLDMAALPRQWQSTKTFAAPAVRNFTYKFFTRLDNLAIDSTAGMQCSLLHKLRLEKQVVLCKHS